MRRRNPPPSSRADARFFTDRSLGKRVYEGLLADGWPVTAMHLEWPRSEHRRLDDARWIPWVSEYGLVILAKDGFAGPVERQCLRDHNARAFTLTSAQLSAEAMIERFVVNKERIMDLAGTTGPYLYKVHPRSLVRIELR